MSDTTVKKIDSAGSPRGEMGQVYLASGVRLGMRLWDAVEAGPHKRKFVGTLHIFLLEFFR